MISKGKSYKIYNPKLTKSGKPMFTVMDYDKNNPTSRRYITVFCQETLSVELYDKQKVFFKEISGVGLNEYQGKLQVTMFADVEPAQEEVVAPTFDVGTQQVVDSSDLPF